MKKEETAVEGKGEKLIMHAYSVTSTLNVCTHLLLILTT